MPPIVAARSGAAACSDWTPTPRVSVSLVHRNARLLPRSYSTHVRQPKEKYVTTLSYSITEPTLRSPVQEWQPHGKQSKTTTEWWYITAVVHDAAGNPYFLVWCPFHFSGEKTSPASAGLPRYERAIAALTGFTDYRNNVHIGDFPVAVVNEVDTWSPTTNPLRFVAGEYSPAWSYQGKTS